MKTYRVKGSSRELGHEPGETFQASIPEAQEKRLIKRGALEVVSSGGNDDKKGASRWGS